MPYSHLPYDKRPPTARLSEDERIELCWRMTMSQLGMPRLCVLRRCRRKKRCFGADMICARHHEALIDERYARLMARLEKEHACCPRRQAAPSQP